MLFALLGFILASPGFSSGVLGLSYGALQFTSRIAGSSSEVLGVSLGLLSLGVLGLIGALLLTALLRSSNSAQTNSRTSVRWWYLLKGHQRERLRPG